MYVRAAAVLFGLIAGRIPDSPPRPHSPVQVGVSPSASDPYLQIMHENDLLWRRGEGIDNLKRFISMAVNNINGIDPSRSMDANWDAVGGQAILDNIDEFHIQNIRPGMVFLMNRILNRLKEGRGRKEFADWLEQKMGNPTDSQFRTNILNMHLKKDQSKATSLHSVVWHLAKRVSQLIIDDGREKTVRSLIECVRPGERVPIKGVPEGVPSDRYGIIRWWDSEYQMSLSHHWYIPEFRQLVRGIIQEPLIELQSENPECEMRVEFVDRATIPISFELPMIGTRNDFAMMFRPSGLPTLFSAIRSLHDMGLLVDFYGIGFVKSPPSHFRLAFSHSYELMMFVDPETREHIHHAECDKPGPISPSCPSRANDMKKLVEALRRQNLGFVSEVWETRLAKLAREVNDLYWFESPDYDSWHIAAREEPALLSYSEILVRAARAEDPLPTCGWIWFLRNDFASYREGCSWSNPDEQLACAGGRELQQLVRRVESNPQCRIELANLLLDAIMDVEWSSGIVQYALWLHSLLGDWQAMDLCQRMKARSFMPFNYVVCPRELFWEDPTAAVVPANYRVVPEDSATADEVESLWNLLRVPLNEDRAIKAFQLADFLIQRVVPTDPRPRLEGLQTLCEAHRHMVTAHVFSSRIAAARVCPSLFSPDEVRGVLRVDLRERLHVKMGLGRLAVRRQSAFADSVSLLTDQLLDSSKPRGVAFVGEWGVDAGGVTREWFSVLGQQLTGTCSPCVLGEESPETCDDQRLFKKREGGSFFVIDLDRVRTEEHLKAWYAFGRLMALAFIKREKITIDLPVYFFARFLKGRVDIEDFNPELKDIIASYLKIAEFPESFFGGMGLYLTFPELSEDEIEVTFANKEEVVQSAIESYSNGPDERAFEEMRAGFSDFIDLEFIRDHMSAAEFKRVLVGDETLDVAQLKSMAEKSAEVSDDCFNWLFEWLENTDVETQHLFMQFVTGSPSFAPRRIRINGPAENQGLLPVSHTCSFTLDLPQYTSIGQLGDAMKEAVPTNIFFRG